MDIPNKTGIRGKLGRLHGKAKKWAKQMGNRKIRAAVKRSLKTQDDHDIHRATPITAWDID